MAKKKQTLKDIQAMYEEKLERVKENAEAKNVELQKALDEAHKQLAEYKKQLEG